MILKSIYCSIKVFSEELALSTNKITHSLNLAAFKLSEGTKR